MKTLAVPSQYRLRSRARELFDRIPGDDLVRHGGALFFATICGSAALYIFHSYASRFLGVELYGVLASLLAIIALITFFAAVGTTIVARFAAGFHAVGDDARLRRLSDLVVRSCALVLAVGMLIAVTLKTALASFLHVGSEVLVELTVVLAALSIAIALLRGLQQGVHRFNALSLSQSIELVGRAALAILGIALGYSVVGALVGQVAASIVAGGYTLFDVRRTFRAQATKLRIDLRRLLVTSAGIVSAYFALAMLVHIDLILAKHYLSAHEAGIYGVATLPGRAVSTIMAFLPTLILPKAAARAAAGKSGNRLLFAAFGVAAAFSLVTLTAFAALPHLIVRIIAGAAYDEAIPLIFSYGCAAAMFALASIAVSYKTGLDRFDFAVPMLVIVVAEVVAIVFYHETAAAIIRVLIAANGLAMLVSLFRITTKGPSPFVPVH